jgi:hypothetical protein
MTDLRVAEHSCGRGTIRFRDKPPVGTVLRQALFAAEFDLADSVREVCQSIREAARAAWRELDEPADRWDGAPPPHEVFDDRIRGD